MAHAIFSGGRPFSAELLHELRIFPGRKDTANSCRREMSTYVGRLQSGVFTAPGAYAMMMTVEPNT